MEPVFQQTGQAAYTLAFSQACLDARAQVKSLTKKLKKAKRVHNRPQVRKPKRKLGVAKTRLTNSC